MRNRSSTGVLSSPAPHLAGELQSSLCMNSMHVCTKRDLILLVVVVVVVVVVCKDHFRGYFTAPTSHPSGRGVPIQPAVCHMYKKYCVCYSFVPSSDLYIPCTLYHVPRILYHMPRTPCPVPRTSHLIPRTMYLVPRTSYFIPLTQHPVLRIDIFWD